MVDTQNSANATSDKTIWAALLSVFLVVPALIPARLAVMLYMVSIGWFEGSSWIPYFDKIFFTFMPEAVRGFVVGMIALNVPLYFFPRADRSLVRYATVFFWGALLSLGFVATAVQDGMSLTLLGLTGFAFGMAGGLWFKAQ
jgi:hypothetical protein